VAVVTGDDDMLLYNHPDLSMQFRKFINVRSNLSRRTSVLVFAEIASCMLTRDRSRASGKSILKGSQVCGRI